MARRGSGLQRPERGLGCCSGGPGAVERAVNTLTQRHRAQQLLMRRATGDQIRAVWPALKYERLDDTYPVLAVSVAAIVMANRRTSNGLAVAYLREMRRQARVAGSLSAVQAPGLV